MAHKTKTLLLTIVMGLFGIMPAEAQYVVHSLKGKVSLERNGQSHAVATGAELLRSDVFNISEGAQITLHNKITNKLHTAEGPATLSVVQIVSKSLERAKMHAENVIDMVDIAKAGGNGAVYEQNGMVRRSQAVLDPEAYVVSVEPESLAIAILQGRNGRHDDASPIEVSAVNGEGLSFKARSVDSSPLYFNIIKLRTDAESGEVKSADISELGQPVNAYVLQPGQELTREHPEATLPGDIHLLVATPFGYDVDALLDSLEELIEAGITLPEPDPELKVFIYTL